MEYAARLKYHQGSPQKVRLVADLIRGRGVEEASSVLQLSKKSAARTMEKLLKSALSNAENVDENLDLDELYVKEIYVDGGPTLKRLRPQPMGRAFRVLKRQSHITIKLATRPDPAESNDS